MMRSSSGISSVEWGLMIPSWRVPSIVVKSLPLVMALPPKVYSPSVSLSATALPCLPSVSMTKAMERLSQMLLTVPSSCRKYPIRTVSFLAVRSGVKVRSDSTQLLVICNLLSSPTVVLSCMRWFGRRGGYVVFRICSLPLTLANRVIGLGISVGTR